MDDEATIADLRRRLAEAEAALHQSEARFAATLESVPAGVATLDMNGQILASNSEYQRFCPTGLMPSQDPARVERWQAWSEDGRLLRPDEFPGARARRGECVTPGQEMIFTDDDERAIWVRVAAVPVRDERNNITGQASVISDIDVLKRGAESMRESEQRQAFLLSLTDAIASLDDTSVIQEVTVDLLGNYLSVDRCIYAELHEEADLRYLVVDAEYRGSDAESYIGLHNVADLGPRFAALQAGRVVDLNDWEQESKNDEIAGRRPNATICSMLGVPLLKHERLVAVVAIQHSSRRIWTKAEIALVSRAAGRTWIAVEHARAEAKLRRKEAELRDVEQRAHRLIDGIAVATWEAAPDGRIVADSPSWRAVTGQTLDAWRKQGWLAVIHPDDQAATIEKWMAAVAARQAVDAEYRLWSSSGSYRWTNVRVIPLLDDAGEVRKWLGVNIDIDERKRLEGTVEDNERRMRALVEGVPQLLWRAVETGKWVWASPQWTNFTGQTEQQAQDDGWLEKVHHDDRELVMLRWDRAEVIGGFDVEHRLRHIDGSYRWFNTRAVPIRDECSNIVEWLGTSNDIDDLRTAQDRQSVMVAELQHRTRNLIAVVSSIASRMLDGASSLLEFERGFSDRLSALSRVQKLLSCATADQRVNFDDLLRTELVALGATGREGGDEHLKLAGPANVPLRSRAVQSLSLAIHELGTNAVKYGALGNNGGLLTITWHVETEKDGILWLHVDWRESGVQIPQPIMTPAIGGYGRQLIEKALPYQLGARTHYAFVEDGVHCTIAVPVVSRRTAERAQDG